MTSCYGIFRFYQRFTCVFLCCSFLLFFLLHHLHWVIMQLPWQRAGNCDNPKHQFVNNDHSSRTKWLICAFEAILENNLFTRLLLHTCQVAFYVQSCSLCWRYFAWVPKNMWQYTSIVYDCSLVVHRHVIMVWLSLRACSRFGFTWAAYMWVTSRWAKGANFTTHAKPKQESYVCRLGSAWNKLAIDLDHLV